MPKNTKKRSRFSLEDVAPYPMPGGVYNFFELPQQRACCACGGKVPDDRYQSCGDPWCSAAVALEPRFRDYRRTVKDQPKHNDPKMKLRLHRDANAAAARRHRETRAYKLSPLVPWSQSITNVEAAYAAFDYTKASWCVNNTWIGQDLRGTADTRQSSLWSKTSRVACAFKAIGGRPAFTLRKRPKYSARQTIIKDLMGGRDSSGAFDVFFAWRCGCRKNHEVIYKTLADLPSGIGYHDACPHCGQAPLEVLTPPQKPKQLELICLATP